MSVSGATREEDAEACTAATLAAMEAVMEECGDREGHIVEVGDGVFVFVSESDDDPDDLDARLEAVLEDLRADD